jgi:Na+/serine symporter
VYQVSASLDALIEMSGGKVSIHVLMAMAAFATIFMGNALEGGLLLAMFNLAHIGKFVLIKQIHYGRIWINNLLHV